LSISLAVIGFGSNRGSRLKYIKHALRLLALNKNLSMLKTSGIYETEPWGFKEQNKFLNAAAVFYCRVGPGELLKIVKDAENKAGRIKREKWRSREIDIDILFLGNKIFKSKKLKIPHKYIAQRNFVLAPLVEIIPDFFHPVLNKKISYLYRNCPDKGKVYRYSDKI